MLLDQISRLSDGDHEQLMMVELFLDCMHFDDNQTLNLRAVDPIADEGVWAIIDDGCNSCCHGEVWRQNAEPKMKVLRLQPIWVHRKVAIFNGVGTSATSGTLNIPMAIQLQESNMVTPRCVHSHEIPKKKTHPFVTVPGVSDKARNDKTCFNHSG